MKYIGFLPDKTSIIKDSLEELNKVPHIEYILVESMKENFVPHYNTPKYTIINPDGSSRVIQIGKYEVIDVDYFDTVKCKGRVARVMEVDTKESHTFRMNRVWSDFLTIELLPLLSELNKIGDLRLYVKLKADEEQIKLLEKTIRERDEIIVALKSRLETIESKNLQ